MIWFLLHPFQSSSSTGDTKEIEKDRQLTDWGGGGGEAKSYDSWKAWPSLIIQYYLPSTHQAM
jgi:hypothetical protein